MRRILLSILCGLGLCHGAIGALPVDSPAPAFELPAAMAGKPFQYSLATALAKGPVVLYFYPAAFSAGCSVEAHAFSEAIDDFAELGATVIGVSGDDIDTLKKFSVHSCQGRFPVASDARMEVVKQYDAAMQTRPDYASRTTYVITPGGKILMSYSNLNPAHHIDKALEALRAWKQAGKPGG
ncbi:peroxiredoxin [Niveibacterium sp. SC-1]|uniref:peroxiredoxin n=1 Tax=Niveibacterium sp. SC-1 TaxID=3135646 RepID=UPI00311FFD6B